jgi:WD40 repeat protein
MVDAAWSSRLRIQAFVVCGCALLVGGCTSGRDAGQAGPGDTVPRPDEKTEVVADAGQSAASDTMLNWWSPPHEIAARSLAYVSQNVTAAECLRFSGDGTRIAAAATPGQVGVWETNTGEILLDADLRGAREVAFRRDSGDVTIGVLDSYHKVFHVHEARLPGGMARPLIDASQGELTSMAVTSDGRHIAVGLKRNGTHLFDVETRELRTSYYLPVKGEPKLCGTQDVAFTADDQFLAAATGDGLVVWRKNGKFVHNFRVAAEAPFSIAIDPCGRHLAAGMQSGTVEVWDMESERLLFSNQGHDGIVCAVAYSPDGSCFVSASQDRTVKFWDARTGEIVRTMSAPAVSFHTLDFSPDGRRIVAGGRKIVVPGKPDPNETVFLWSVTPPGTLE